MSKAIVIYGSTTGNAEEMANSVEKAISGIGIDVVLKNVTDAEPAELAEYDYIFLGSSTWGDGELQDDFISFEEEMRTLDLKGKKGAVFGCGETSWAMFCEAVNILEETLKSCGAEIMMDGFKVDGDVMVELENISAWAVKEIQK